MKNEEKYTLANVGYFVTRGGSDEGIIPQEGKGVPIDIPGVTDSKIIIELEKGILKVLFMKKKTELPFYR
ncbi:hypothetical protein BEH94_03895 [Candidatus Altiarchaeales archaeon WOR_SM1_SCG]|nr:hypothetical protein BEH94_03895 [Candidatus Altiarchaeales archaeon WOR_SM1_SCG]